MLTFLRINPYLSLKPSEWGIQNWQQNWWLKADQLNNDRGRARVEGEEGRVASRLRSGELDRDEVCGQLDIGMDRKSVN